MTIDTLRELIQATGRTTNDVTSPNGSPMLGLVERQGGEETPILVQLGASDGYVSLHTVVATLRLDRFVGEYVMHTVPEMNSVQRTVRAAINMKNGDLILIADFHFMDMTPTAAFLGRQIKDIAFYAGCARDLIREAERMEAVTPDEEEHVADQ